MLVRRTMHSAGAGALAKVLNAPGQQRHAVPCACGGEARYHDIRSRQLLTVLGPISLQRAWYVCPHCGKGFSPRDAELDIAGTQFSPGVRRMMAVVGSESSFEHGREELELLAGLEVTAKAVERQAEAIGTDIEARPQTEIRRAKQLEPPAVCVPDISTLHTEMDGTGVPVVKAETEGGKGKTDGEPAHTREVRLGCVFTQTVTDDEGRPVRDRCGRFPKRAGPEPVEMDGQAG